MSILCLYIFPKKFKYDNIIRVKIEMQARYYQFALDYTKKITEYCLTYNAWPKQFSNPQNAQEELSNKLYKWLQGSHFFSKNKPFKYQNVCNEEGVLIVNILRSLYEKYFCPKSYDSKRLDYILSRIKSIQKYCEEYQEWPKQMHHPATEKEFKSDNYARWLKSSNYKSKEAEFKYATLKDSKGCLIITILDDLYAKYYVPLVGTEENIIAITNDIISYCITYNEWPTSVKSPQSKKDELANRLTGWLHKSHFYYPERFKYAHINYRENLKVQGLLELYYVSYGSSVRLRQDSYYTKLKPRIKDDIIFLLYNCIIKLFHTITTSYESYLLYLEKIKNMISTYNINITIEEISNYLRLSDEELQNIFYQKYCIYSLANINDLAYLYHLLYIAFLPRNNIAQERVRKTKLQDKP